MQKYLRLTKHLTQEFDRVEFVQIPRSQNMIPNKIAKQVSLEERSTSMVLEVEVQKQPESRKSLPSQSEAQATG